MNHQCMTAGELHSADHLAQVAWAADSGVTTQCTPCLLNMLYGLSSVNRRVVLVRQVVQMPESLRLWPAFARVVVSR